ncbi:MAG: exodeoxyribonuclease VII small subunit [Thermaurantimonas sp.]|uniref:exodeoxyribonuclease VII small subunit n=1 Tax=Thermaurantimonas sp. TaxID=2681568 RepID=UPI00391B3B54
MENAENELTYTAAIDELQTIADQLEQEDIDPDKMVKLIQRAEFLVNFCKKKLSETEKTVQEILSKLQNTDQETLPF